jgi:prepilin-type N-terminal cleavage/methylation domain-containing protein
MKFYLKGFTIVEISAALVIIATLAAVVTVSTAMIEAGRIKAELSQLDQFDTATTTFFDAYGVLPGDMSNTNASKYFPNSFSAANCPTSGNENGIISVTTLPLTTAADETNCFFYHLSAANLIQNKYVPVTTTYTIGSAFPSILLNPLRGIFAYASTDRLNYFYYGLVSNAVNQNVSVTDDTFRPLELKKMDLKIDDGLPLSGNMRGFSSGTTWPPTNYTTVGTCIASSDYSSTNTRGCQMRFLMSVNQNR